MKRYPTPITHCCECRFFDLEKISGYSCKRHNADVYADHMHCLDIEFIEDSYCDLHSYIDENKVDNDYYDKYIIYHYKAYPHPVTSGRLRFKKQVKIENMRVMYSYATLAPAYTKFHWNTRQNYVF